MAIDFPQIELDAAAEEECLRLVRLAVAEDLERQQDWTTVALVPMEATGRAVMAARRAGIVARIARRSRRGGGDGSADRDSCDGWGRKAQSQRARSQRNWPVRPAACSPPNGRC